MSDASSGDPYDWGFASGRVSVLEGRLVPTEFFHALVAIEHSDDLLHRLQETQMREYLAPGATWEDWSAITDTYFCDHVASLRKDCPEPTVSDLFALSNDYINLKRALLNLGSYPMAFGTFSEGLLSSVAAGDLTALPREVREPLAGFSGGLAADPNARLALDIVLDGAYLRQVLALGDKLGVPLIRSWLSEMTLARAAVALWRAARVGVNLRLYQQYFLPVAEHTAVLSEMISSGDPQNWGAIIPGEIGDLW
ncbi:MAG: V-type ATPase subunit, partial [Candidatus Hydrogenedentes bacterium]|nr:V-type ATPase subunit [Candidatus Hydrogenedentota bacterium]